MKNTHRGVLILVKLQAKINTPPWVFFTFFEIVQMLPNRAMHHMCDKVYNNGPNKICGRQALVNRYESYLGLLQISAWFKGVFVPTLRDQSQISFLLLNEFKRINFYSPWSRQRYLQLSYAQNTSYFGGITATASLNKGLLKKYLLTHPNNYREKCR